LNKDALKQLGSEKKKLVVVPNATHLFEEPGILEVARLASGWFCCYFQIHSIAEVVVAVVLRVVYIQSNK
jgi:hypothetical protein